MDAVVDQVFNATPDEVREELEIAAPLIVAAYLESIAVEYDKAAAAERKQIQRHESSGDKVLLEAAVVAERDYQCVAADLRQHVKNMTGGVR